MLRLRVAHEGRLRVLERWVEERLLRLGVRQELERELVQRIRDEVGPFANFRRAVVVNRLPKTRSGKILRQVVRRMVDGKPYTTPSTIDDPAIIPEIGETLRHLGIMRDRT